MAKVWALSTGQNAKGLPGNSVVIFTNRPDMVIAVDRGRKPKQKKKKNKINNLPAKEYRKNSKNWDT